MERTLSINGKPIKPNKLIQLQLTNKVWMIVNREIPNAGTSWTEIRRNCPICNKRLKWAKVYNQKGHIGFIASHHTKTCFKQLKIIENASKVL